MAKQTFETALENLETIVTELESGKLTLENSLKKFEEGMKLAQFCADKLDETERKIVLLTRNSQGKPVETPFLQEE